MNKRRMLLVYYSRSGNGKKAADSIRKIINCDVEEIIDRKNRKGIFGYILSGRDAVTGKAADICPLQKNPSEYDVVIVGSPVWASKLSTPIKTFLLQNQDKIKEAAFYCTEGGGGSEKVFGEVEDILNKKVLAKLCLLDREIKNNNFENKLKDFLMNL